MQVPLVPEEFAGQHVPVALSDGKLPKEYITVDSSQEDSKEEDKKVLTDTEVYTEATIAAYQRLMDITFYDAAADMGEDEEGKPKKEKSY